jgi:hypothetical protein
MPEKLPPADSLKKLTAAEKKALKAKRKGITDGQ